MGIPYCWGPTSRTSQIHGVPCLCDPISMGSCIVGVLHRFRPVLLGSGVHWSLSMRFWDPVSIGVLGPLVRLWDPQSMGSCAIGVPCPWRPHITRVPHPGGLTQWDPQSMGSRFIGLLDLRDLESRRSHIYTSILCQGIPIGSQYLCDPTLRWRPPSMGSRFTGALYPWGPASVGS